LPYLAFGDSDTLRVGDRVLAIGNPFGLGQTVTSGIVSALARTSFGIGDFRFFIQTDAAINPGNSGGAQIDLEGRLVGINTAIFSTSGGSQGLGFAIPSNMVRAIVESAVEGRPLVRPWLGISGRRIPPQIAGALGLTGNRGVLVAAVHAASPAAAAGFAPGDVVVALDGHSVDDPEALHYRIALRRPGTGVRLTALRQRRRYEIPVTVVAPPEVPPRDDRRLSPLSPFRGAIVASLSPALAEEVGADSAISGVLVLDVGRGSAAAELDLRRGDIIRGLDASEIATVADLEAIRFSPFRPWRLVIVRTGNILAIDRPRLKGMGR
jgi:serine protease Do